MKTLKIKECNKKISDVHTKNDLILGKLEMKVILWMTMTRCGTGEPVLLG